MRRLGCVCRFVKIEESLGVVVRPLQRPYKTVGRVPCIILIIIFLQGIFGEGYGRVYSRLHMGVRH